MSATGLRLPPFGAPGLRWLPPNPIRSLTGERMDVCAFVGVAPRGPARVPLFSASWAPRVCREGATGTRSVAVAVESWSEYIRLFGRFDGPGLLPYAVASFFENGGARAYIVRIVHDYVLPDENAKGVASAVLMGIKASAAGGKIDVRLRARDEGTWGNRLRAELTFSARPLPLESSEFTATSIVFPLGVTIVAGATLRLEHPDGTKDIARISRVWEEWHPKRAVIVRHALFDEAVTLPVARAELIEGELAVDDGDGRIERHIALGLTPTHARWLARVLVEDSSLLYPDEAWHDGRDLLIDPSLRTCNTEGFGGGENRYRDLIPDDFFDPRWTLNDECPGDGVHALTQLTDLSLVVVPDLYSPKRLAPVVPVIDSGGAGAEFCPCEDGAKKLEQLAQPEDLEGLRLDPAVDTAAIIDLQRHLIDLATDLESFIVLLDVPPGLSQRRMLAWREQLHSMYAAAYHPWLMVSRPDDARDAAIAVNPAAVAAGIIAKREAENGVQYGPANELALGVFDVADRVSPARHDELHQGAINVYLHECDGVRLSAARTLSADQSYRQVSVRRLMTMLRRVLYRQMQWAVFEPNDYRLREDIRNQLDAYLRQLFIADAFVGARAEDAFFVRCDEDLNPPRVVDAGRLFCYVGVAPAEPLEFLLLQISRDGDGTLRVQG